MNPMLYPAYRTAEAIESEQTVEPVALAPDTVGEGIEERVIRVLMVEDNLADAELIQISLSQAHLPVITRCVETRDDFAREVEVFAPDVILADYSLPQFSGVAALRLVRDMGLSTPFILVSGAVGDEKAVEILKNGATDYILKDNLVKLVPSIRRAIDDAEEREKRHAAEALLRRQTELYQTLLQAQSDIGLGMLLLDNDHYTFVNDAYCALTGYSREELLALPSVSMLIPPDKREAYINRSPEIRSAEQSDGHVETTIISKDKQCIDVDLSAKVLELDGRVVTMVIVRDITERKRAEEALRDSESRFRSVTESANDAIISSNSSGKIVSWNKGAGTIFGYNDEEALGQSLSMLMPERYRAGHDAGMHRVNTTGETHVIGNTVELHGLRKDGTEFPLELSLSSWQWDNDNFYSGIMRDITERKKAEQALRENEQRLFQILEAIPIGIFVTDSTGKGYFANQIAENILGKGIDPNANSEDLAETYGVYIENTQELYPVEHMPLVRALAGEQSMVDNMEVKRPDGRLLMEVRGAPVYDAGGKIVYAVTAFSDITLRKRDEVVMRELASIVESSTDAMLSCTPDGTILAWNRGAERLYGHSRLEVAGKTISIIVPPDLMDHMKGLLQGIKNGESFQNIEAERLKKDGTRFPVELTLSPTRAADGSVVGYSAIARDITVRKQAEVALANIAHRLEQSNQELERFAFAASHDLQEPLRKIQAFASRLRDKYAQQLSTDALDSLDYILDAASRLEAMIKGVLALSRVASRGQPFERVNLGEMAHEVLADLELRIEKTGAHVEIGDLPTIDADPQQVRQLLQNLIGNALKFHKGDVAPIVTVTSEAFELEKSGYYRTTSRLTTSNLMPLNEPGRVPMFRVTVQDNGIGFDEKFLDRIFMPFQRLHTASEYEGTGMGLAICRKIVERHDGTMTATSTPGSGATFVITLPSRSTLEGLTVG